MSINQMTKDRREAYVEVLEILKNMDKKYVSKIPRELREYFERNASKEYEFRIDKSIPLEEHKFKENTINILAMLNINYWCEDEGHKQVLLKKYYENDLRRETELREIYNTDNLLKKERNIVNSESKSEEYISDFPLQQIEYKWYEKIYEVVLKFIKKLFKKEL